MSAQNTTGSGPSAPDAPHPCTNILLSAILSPMGGPASFSTLGSGRGSRSSPVTRSSRNCETSPQAVLPGETQPTRPSRTPLEFRLLFLLPGPAARSDRSDPKDSYLLALAEASEAEFLVTGDKELLSLKHHKSTRVIAPAAMVEILKKAENGEQRED